MNLLHKVTRIRTLGKCFGTLLIFTSASLLAEDKTVTEDWVLTKNEVVEGTLTVNSNEKIVQWKTRPADGVKFVLQRGDNNCAGGGLVVEDDGLYIKNGFSLIIR